MRFLLFVAGVWLVMQILKMVFQGLSRPSPPRQKRTYGVGGSPAQSPQEEFKNIQEADFVDITESDKGKGRK